jgi:hypothetical protein
MTDRQMKNGAAEFDAVTQQTCRPCSRRRYEPLRAVGEAAPNRRHEEGFSRYAGTAQRSARQSVADSHKGRWRGIPQRPSASAPFWAVCGFSCRADLTSLFHDNG